MYKHIILLVTFIAVFTGCMSTKNLLTTDELGDYVANQGEIKSSLIGSVLEIKTTADTESMSVVLPKDNLTLRIKIAIPNVEDILYMNITTDDDFKLNKLIRRVSNFNELDPNEDGWVFEPSIEKNVVTLQLYLPAIYLYTTQFNPILHFAYKRSARSLQDSIAFHFIKEQYFPTFDKQGHEIAQYADLETYCAKTGNAPSQEFLDQIDQLNPNRIDQETKNKLRGICQ